MRGGKCVLCSRCCCCCSDQLSGYLKLQIVEATFREERPKRAVVGGSGGGSGGGGTGPRHPYVRSSRRRPKLCFRGHRNEPDHPSRAALPACADDAAAGLPEDLRAAVLLVHHRQAAFVSSASTPPRSETHSSCEARLSGEQIRLSLRRRRADRRPAQAASVVPAVGYSPAGAPVVVSSGSLPLRRQYSPAWEPCLIVSRPR